MKSLFLLAFCTLLKYAGSTCYSGSSPVLCSICGGSCTSDNGCLCSDDITNCIPTSTECLMEDNTCCNNIAGLYWNGSLQCCSDGFSCNPDCLSDQVCEARNDVPTCVCNNSTYNGTDISDLKPSVICENEEITVSVSRCQLQHLGYNYSSMHINNDSSACTFRYPDIINNIIMESIKVKTAIDWCGNLVSKNGCSKIFIFNTLHIDPNTESIITKNPIVFNFSCEYNLTNPPILNSAVKNIVTLPSQGESGSYTITLAAFSDAAFSVPIRVCETIKVGTSVYLAFSSFDMDGSLFALRVETCYASPSNNPADSNKIVFVSGGCAVDGDILTTVISNGNSTEARIQTSAFQFRGYTEVYIYCDVRACYKTSECEGCNFALNVDSSQLGIQLNLGMCSSKSMTTQKNTVAEPTLPFPSQIEAQEFNTSIFDSAD